MYEIFVQNSKNYAFRDDSEDSMNHMHLHFLNLCCTAQHLFNAILEIFERPFLIEICQMKN